MLLRTSVAQARALVGDTDGNIALMTALLAIPLMLAGGMAMDYSYASSERVRLQILADSAALAAGGTFDGTNPAEAKKRAEAILKGYSADLPTGSSFTVSVSGQSLEVTLNSYTKNAFMALGGFETTAIGVKSVTLSPMKPKKIVFTPTKAQGWYYKKVSIIVTRPTTGIVETVGTVIYQPTTQADNGQGPITVLPQGTLELGEYSKLVLQMEIKNDGCGIGQDATIKSSKVYCFPSTTAADQKYDLTLRTDNPATSHYLFVDGVQLPQGVLSPLGDILECGKTSNHAWEDGGGFARQDFFYTATSTCAPDGRFVRLTK